MIILTQRMDLFALLLRSNNFKIERLNILKGRHTPGEWKRGQAPSVYGWTYVAEAVRKLILTKGLRRA